mmetsp:Transcript_13038/g.52565  ORF Transcript_13038/g.52565 Transcript_13038/m.52565 type:complete len:309 (+) Transcript_13038:154-1080(+)
MPHLVSMRGISSGMSVCWQQTSDTSTFSTPGCATVDHAARPFAAPTTLVGLKTDASTWVLALYKNARSQSFAAAAPLTCALTTLPHATALIGAHVSTPVSNVAPTNTTASTSPAPFPPSAFASTRQHRAMASHPTLYPTSVTGLMPCFRSSRAFASASPASPARAMARAQGESINWDDFRSSAGHVTAAAMPASEVYPMPCPTAYDVTASCANEVIASPSSTRRACSHPTTCCSPLGSGQDAASSAAAIAESRRRPSSVFSEPPSPITAGVFFSPPGVPPTKGTTEATETTPLPMDRRASMPARCHLC